MNRNKKCDFCDVGEEHQHLQVKTTLLKHHEFSDPGDCWHNRSMLHICFECSEDLFDYIDKKTGIKPC